MKNTKLLLTIYFLMLIICSVTFTVFYILGNKTRTGYLSNFLFDSDHINKTLKLNGLDSEKTKKLFTINGKLDNEALTNYIFTNKSITNYSYGLKVGYYSKVFKHSDLYGV